MKAALIGHARKGAAMDFFLTDPIQQMDPGDPGDWFLWADCCRQLRPAKTLVVLSDDNGLSFGCAENTGCKSPEEIKAKQKQRFRNRSAE